MDGVHDMGGMDGFGAVDAEAVEAGFEGWEARLQAVALLSGGMTRSGIEELPAHVYLAATYHERWLLCAETRLVERGVLGPEDLDHWRARLQHPDAQIPRHDAPGELAELERVLFTTPRMEPVETAAFSVGDRVRVRRIRPRHHHRCPRYVRGVVGRVEHLPGADHPPQGPFTPEVVEPVYTVSFSSVDLWGDAGDGEAPFEVLVDLWQSYLEAP